MPSSRAGSYFFSSAKNAAAAEKFAKNHYISLKGNNSLRSDKFSFLTLHVLILLTHFFKGRRTPKKYSFYHSAFNSVVNARNIHAWLHLI